MEIVKIIPTYSEHVRILSSVSLYKAARLHTCH